MRDREDGKTRPAREYMIRKKRKMCVIYVSECPQTNLALTSLVTNKLVKNMQCRGSGRCSDVDVWYQPVPRHQTWTCDLCLLPDSRLCVCVGCAYRSQSPHKKSYHLRRMAMFEHVCMVPLLHVSVFAFVLPNTSF